MNRVRAPRSLRTNTAIGSVNERPSGYSSGKVSAVAGLVAVASFSSAEAQQTNLPPVSVDAPVARPKPAASAPSPDQIKARNALRRAARRQQQAKPAAPVPAPALAADRDRYADPAAPYKGDRLQASGKFPEPLLNTPKTVTVLTKDIIEDKNATTLKQAILSTAGVTLGSGEGGNAFGDRFFIRGFDARNDVFIDGVRDAGVSVRENFFTEQVEILRGPASSFAGRGTTGGAINIVAKEAQTDKSFYNMDTTFGTDQTRRIQLDVNQVISPTFAMRAGGMFQDADVAGRNYVTDDRSGGFVATKWTPTDTVKVTTDYIHTDLHGIPDFGVPYYRPSATTSSSNQQFNTTAGGPYPDYGVNRNNFYGFIYRDFFRVQQDIGTVNTEVKITPDLTFNDKVRVSRSLNNYIGTLPESPSAPIPLTAATFTANPQSRYQATDVLANQSEATYKFNTGDFKHTILGGVEVDRETSSIDKYSGFSSELITGVPFLGSGSVAGQSVFSPSYNFTPFGTAPTLIGKPTAIAIDTVSGYALDSLNYRDLVILNGGVRYDDYRLNTSGWGTGALNSLFNTQSAEFGLPNFSLGVALKPLPYASVYAAYATSSNPVGAEFDGTSTAYGGIAPVLAGNPNQIFGPEKNQAIEVGTKWELFNRHLLLTGALFQTNKENAREAFNVSGPGNPNCPYPTGVTGNVSCIIAGSAYYVRGIDLEADGKITDKWSIFGGLVLMQSQVTRSNVPAANMPQPLLYTTNVGLPLANVAHRSFSLLSKYELTDVWEVGGQAVYRSKIYGGQLLAANEGTSIPSYWKFDAFVEAKINKNWKLKLYINNITNKLYYDALYQSAAPFVLEAPGRAAYLVLSARY
ncbi:TonB-dependent receptor [Bradyrhizobium sp.]|uniref:TonB-dependent receptor n=1 Tax=Bradyrhizobium sp. TaxID=376 RepID=UPI0026078C63|nr:TonB-dependent receptor [Bradyrhizobium sp.]